MRLMPMPFFAGQTQPNNFNKARTSNSTQATPRFGQDQQPRYEDTYYSTSGPVSHDAMLQHFIDKKGKEIDLSKTREQHDTLLQVMWGRGASQQLIEKYHGLVKKHYGE